MIGEPSTRATQLLAFRSAALTLWGTAGWRDIVERLPPRTREVLVADNLVVAVGWVPERYMLDLAEAVCAGPALGSHEAYREFVGHVIALGFGRVRRLLVQFAPPGAVLKRAPELWRHDHTHGELDVAIEDRRAVVHMDHPVLTTTPLSRQTASEMFRSVLGLTRARDVVEEHGLEPDGRLKVVLRWQ